MEYKNTTQEQKDGITPWLRKQFDMIDEESAYEIKCFQQAQKEEIKFIQRIKISDIFKSYELSERFRKLKFESELI